MLVDELFGQFLKLKSVMILYNLLEYLIRLLYLLRQLSSEHL